jgi:hypothetical protein
MVFADCTSPYGVSEVSLVDHAAEQDIDTARAQSSAPSEFT